MNCPQCSAPIRKSEPHAQWFECGSELINSHFWPSLKCQTAKVSAVQAEAWKLADDMKRRREARR